MKYTKNGIIDLEEKPKNPSKIDKNRYKNRKIIKARITDKISNLKKNRYFQGQMRTNGVKAIINEGKNIFLNNKKDLSCSSKKLGMLYTTLMNRDPRLAITGKNHFGDEGEKANKYSGRIHGIKFLKMNKTHSPLRHWPLKE